MLISIRVITTPSRCQVKQRILCPIERAVQAAQLIQPAFVAMSLLQSRTLSQFPILSKIYTSPPAAYPLLTHGSCLPQTTDFCIDLRNCIFQSFIGSELALRLRGRLSAAATRTGTAVLTSPILAMIAANEYPRIGNAMRIYILPQFCRLYLDYSPDSKEPDYVWRFCVPLLIWASYGRVSRCS